MYLLEIDPFLSHSLIQLEHPLALVREVEVVEAVDVVKKMFPYVVIIASEDIVIIPITPCMDFLPRLSMYHR